MGLASFFYDGSDLPTAEQLLDMARQCLIACEVQNTLDAETCRAFLDGLAKSWAAARKHEEGDDHHDRVFDTAREAERAYHQTFVANYRAAIKRNYPDADIDASEVGWWPDGLSHRRGWPVAFLAALARTHGQIDADSTMAMWRYYAAKRTEDAERGR